MKLFKVEHKVMATRFFSNKMKAKAVRDKYIAGGDYATVKRGPDHWRGES